MQTIKSKMNPFDTIKQIWQLSWRSLWQGKKRLLSIVLTGYGALLIIILASFGYLNMTGKLSRIFAAHQVFLPLIDTVIMVLIIMLALNFVMAALMTRGYGWLHHDKALIDKTWHNARKTYLKLFLIHVIILLFDMLLQMVLIKFAHYFAVPLQVIVASISLIIYITVFSLPCLIYAPIVIEGMPLGKAVTQGFKLLKNNYAFTLSVVVIGIFFPTIFVFSLLKIPVLNILFSFLILFGYYPFLLIVVAFTNLLVYEAAIKKYLDKMTHSGLEAKQA